MKLQPALIFGEHMVLQRDKEIKIWGTSAEDDIVSVRLNEQLVKTQAVNGDWMVTLKPEEANNKTSMEISSELTGEKICFNDIAIGEVWLAGGQSNMEFIMKYDFDFETTKKLPDDELLRSFTYPQVAYKGVLEDNSHPEQGFWRLWKNENDRQYLSAVATYAAMILRKKLDVPVGIIVCNWGGTPAAAWAAMEDIKNEEALKKILDWHEEGVKNTDWVKYYNASEAKQEPVSEQQKAFNDRFMMGEFGKEFFENFDPSTMPVLDYAPYNPGPRSVVRPAGLYENMLCKVAPYAIRGFLWYQGEDDDARDWYDIYDVSMKTMIGSWRKLWNEELPFYQIELAPFRGVGVTAAKKYDLIRHKQEKVSKELKDVYEVCILDAGEEYNIHPRHKKMVGERLGHIVMKHSYDDDSLTADCPRVIEAKKDKDIIISFDNSADGLVINGDLKEYLIVSHNNEKIDYEARTEKDKLILSGDFPEDKLTIKFCETNYCIDPLYNSEGSPVFGFTLEV